MTYALIVNKKVENIVELAERTAEKYPNAVKLNGRPAGVGDDYIDGKFYRDGVEVLTPYEELEQKYDEALNNSADGLLAAADAAYREGVDSAYD